MIGSESAAGSQAVNDAYRVCERLAAAHYENFPVASHLLPQLLGRKTLRDIPRNKLVEWSDIEGPVL